MASRNPAHSRADRPGDASTAATSRRLAALAITERRVRLVMAVALMVGAIAVVIVGAVLESEYVLAAGGVALAGAARLGASLGR